MAAKNLRLYRWLITKHTIYDNNHTEDEKETNLDQRFYITGNELNNRKQ